MIQSKGWVTSSGGSSGLRRPFPGGGDGPGPYPQIAPFGKGCFRLLFIFLGIDAAVVVVIILLPLGSSANVEASKVGLALLSGAIGLVLLALLAIVAIAVGISRYVRRRRKADTPAAGGPSRRRHRVAFVAAVLSVGLVAVVAGRYYRFIWACRQGVTALDRGDPAGAIDYFNKAIGINPESALTFHKRAIARCDKGDLEGSIADCNTSIRLDPKFDGAYTTRAQALLKAGDLAGAIADCNKAIELKPESESAYFVRTMAREDQGDYGGAVADYTKAIEVGPAFAVVYCGRGAAFRKMGNLGGAIADYRRAIKVKPTYAVGYIELALICATADDSEYRDVRQALVLAEQARALPLKEPGLLCDVAEVYAAVGYFDMAVKVLEEAIRMLPDGSSPLRARSEIILQRYRAGEARQEEKWQ